MKKIKEIVFQKKNVFIAILFLSFFPVRALFYNGIYYFFDLILNSGVVSNIYSFNYMGNLMGCLEIQQVQEALGAGANMYYSIVFNFLFLVSFLSGLILIKRIKSSNDFSLINWFLLMLFSFSLFDALEFFIMSLPSIIEFGGLFKVTARWVALIEFSIILLMAIYLFYIIFYKSVKVRILLIVLPTSFISFVVWYSCLGPHLLPVKIL